MKRIEDQNQKPKCVVLEIEPFKQYLLQHLKEADELFKLPPEMVLLVQVMFWEGYKEGAKRGAVMMIDKYKAKIEAALPGVSHAH